MTRPTPIQRPSAKFSKRYATNCRSALRTFAMMQQAGSTESKMDQVSFLRGTDNGGALQQMEPRKSTLPQEAAGRAKRASLLTPPPGGKQCSARWFNG